MSPYQRISEGEAADPQKYTDELERILLDLNIILRGYGFHKLALLNEERLRRAQARTTTP